MHPKAVQEIVASVRRRASQGDCPTEPPFGKETLEETVLAAGEWTERERAAIDELRKSQELSEHAVLRQGLRWYQFIVHHVREGFPVVRFQAYDGTMKPQDTKLPPDAAA